MLGVFQSDDTTFWRLINEKFCGFYLCLKFLCRIAVQLDETNPMIATDFIHDQLTVWLLPGLILY